MQYWKKFWQNYRPLEPNTEEDMLYQVGLTINGKPISSQIFNTILDDITQNLELSNNDSVLDLCCGNGLITSRIAQKVKDVTGVDFSENLLNTARTYNAKNNIRYVYSDLTDKEESLKLLQNQIYNKVYMYGSFAYFNREDLNDLFLLTKEITDESTLIFIGGVLDSDKKWNFYNTFSRKLDYLKHKFRKNDPGVGNWWNKEELTEICNGFGFSCSILEQKKILHTYHYRFDMLLKKTVRK